MSYLLGKRGARIAAIAAYLGLAVAAMLTGLVLRLARLGMPYWLTKWGGSVLWAAMVYWLVATMMPSGPVRKPALTAVGIAWAVEAFRLIHTPSLDAFRLTLAGVLLLGRVFSPLHLAVYAGAIALAGGLDWLLLRRRQRR